MTGLQTKNLRLAYADTIIIDELDLQIPKGKITILIGANGCGKSTLLRAFARLLKPASGNVLLDDENIHRLKTKAVAKQLAILPQSPIAPSGLTVLQLVKQGRYPYQTWLNQWSEQDEKVVMQALNSTGMYDLMEHEIESLSGGQQQRAWIAMTLAQDTDIILLDEPTTFLDLTHQIEILDLLFDLNEQEKRTIVMVLHDLNLACRYAHQIIALHDQQIYAQGKPEEIINCQLIQDVFSMDCQVTSDPIFGTPLCIPQGKGRRILRETH